MSYLPAVPPVPRSALAALGIAAAVVAIWLWARISRTRHVVIQASESVLTAVVQLERIANAMDRIVFLTEARARTADAIETKNGEHAGQSGTSARSAIS